MPGKQALLLALAAPAVSSTSMPVRTGMERRHSSVAGCACCTPAHGRRRASGFRPTSRTSRYDSGGVAGGTAMARIRRGRRHGRSRWLLIASLALRLGTWRAFLDLIAAAGQGRVEELTAGGIVTRRYSWGVEQAGRGLTTAYVGAGRRGTDRGRVGRLAWFKHAPVRFATPPS